jgi:hypothetical protein
LADEVSEPTVKAMMLRMAADYDRLVKCSEERRAPKKLVSGSGDPRSQGSLTSRTTSRPNDAMRQLAQRVRDHS